MKTKLELSLPTFVRWFIAVVLILAAISKLTDPPEFFNSLLAYQLPMPRAVLKSIAYGLPCIELGVGVMLSAGLRLRPALICAIILFAIFTIATGQAWARGLNISCGCFKLKALGINLKAGDSIEHFVESPAFACIRAVLFLLATAWLLRLKSPVSARPIED